MSDYIPQDSFPEILKFLPVKSVLRFRAVCKWWKEVIDSPSFVEEHLALQRNPKLLLKYEELELLVVDPVTLPKFDTLDLPDSFVDSLSDEIDDHDTRLYRLVGTKYGVVCLYDNVNDFLLWNPSIRKFSTLPLPDELETYDDLKCGYFGFWIDPCAKNNFKIIVFEMVYKFDDDNEIVDGVIYSSILQDWISLPVFNLSDYVYKAFPEGPPVMIEGVAYWRANTEWIDDLREEESEYLGTIILSFDFVEECFDVTELPRYADELTLTLCNLLDTLAAVYWGLEEGARCDVYIYEDEWVNVFAFDLSLAPMYSVLWVTGKTEETCRVLAVTTTDLVIYDAIDICSCTDVLCGLKNPANMFVAHGFVESLFFPDM